MQQILLGVRSKDEDITTMDDHSRRICEKVVVEKEYVPVIDGAVIAPLLEAAQVVFHAGESLWVINIHVDIGERIVLVGQKKRGYVQIYVKGAIGEGSDDDLILYGVLVCDEMGGNVLVEWYRVVG